MKQPKYAFDDKDYLVEIDEGRKKEKGKRETFREFLERLGYPRLR